jgi:uncharacterized membrane protein
MEFLKMYGIAFVIFLAIDAVWLGLVAPRFYRAQIGHLMSDSPNLVAALIFYLIFIVGVVVFVIQPAIDGNWTAALWRGLLFGFVTYATYDLTNLATLRDWPLTVTVVDLAWGTFLGGTMGVLTHLIYNAF